MINCIQKLHDKYTNIMAYTLDITLFFYVRNVSFLIRRTVAEECPKYSNFVKLNKIIFHFCIKHGFNYKEFSFLPL